MKNILIIEKQAIIFIRLA